MVVLGALVTAIVTSKGWPTVKATFFSWSSLKDSFPDILRGFWLDVKIFCIVEVVVLVLGLAIALARSSRAPALAPLRVLGTLWVDVLRGIPTILVIYLIGFGVPALELAHVPSRCPTPRTWPRSTARESSRCTPASARPRSRSGSTEARRCAT